MSKGNEDKPLNGLAYNANIQDEEGPHIYISCNLQNYFVKAFAFQHVFELPFFDQVVWNSQTNEQV